MIPAEPLPLHHRWPLYERGRQFELGCILDGSMEDLPEVAVREALGRNSAGWWECDLADDALTWTAGVHRIFGLPQCAHVTRAEAVALYSEESRATMERLRAFGIENRRCFALDAEIRPANGRRNRWMRLIAAPVCEGGQVVRLHGLKLLI